MQTVFVLSICVLLTLLDQQTKMDQSQRIACIDMEFVLESTTGISIYTWNQSGERELAELSDDQIIRLSEGMSRIKNVIEKFAAKLGITTVVQVNTERIDPQEKTKGIRSERISLLRQLSSPVVYHRRINISQMVIHRIKQKQ